MASPCSRLGSSTAEGPLGRHTPLRFRTSGPCLAFISSKGPPPDRHCASPSDGGDHLVRKHACVDGPEIDAHAIDREKLLPRFGPFRAQGQASRAADGFWTGRSNTFAGLLGPTGSGFLRCIGGPPQGVVGTLVFGACSRLRFVSI